MRIAIRLSNGQYPRFELYIFHSLHDVKVAWIWCGIRLGSVTVAARVFLPHSTLIARKVRVCLVLVYITFAWVFFSAKWLPRAKD